MPSISALIQNTGDSPNADATEPNTIGLTTFVREFTVIFNPSASPERPSGACTRSQPPIPVADGRSAAALATRTRAAGPQVPPANSGLALEDGTLRVVTEHLLKGLDDLSLARVRAGALEKRVHEVAPLLRSRLPEHRHGLE